MDEIHEVSGMKLEKLRDVTTERKQWRRPMKSLGLKESTAQGDKVRSIIGLTSTNASKFQAIRNVVARLVAL